MGVLASDFTGPLYVVMGLGLAVAGVGLLMVVAIFMGWAPEARRPRGAAKASAGPWDVVKQVLEKIFQWVPKAYQFPVALIMLGALIMIIPLAIGLTASGDGDSPTPTTSVPSTAGSAVHHRSV
jgi:hypothetical protein